MSDAHVIDEAFEEWAAARGFVEDEAFLVGEIDGARVEIDTGTRGDKAYATVVRIHEGLDDGPANLRATDATNDEEPAMTRALHAAIREDDAVAVLWTDKDLITVRSKCGDPEKIERAVKRVLGAKREVEAQRLREISDRPYR